jgi:hypothetical protein
MFILIFLVMFGPKKGSIVAYAPNWDFNFKKQTQALVYYIKSFNSVNLVNSLMFRYHFTVITSRATSYVLFTFWVFFFFYGETLLLVMFNFSTTVDTINSSSFFTIKQHIIFYLISTSAKLTNCINFYIFFLTSCSFMYLVNMNYSYNYNYFRQSSVNSILIPSIFLIYTLVNFVL